MPTLADKIKAQMSEIRTMFKSPLKVADKGNVDSVLTPSDTDNTDYQQSQREDDYVALVKKHYLDAGQYRRQHEGRILTGVAMFRGYQWVEYSSGSGMLTRIAGTEDPKQRFRWLTFNHIRPLVEMQQAHACYQYPDVWSAPLTDSDEDKAAAATERAILGHCYRINNRMEMLRNAVMGTLIGSTVWICPAWNPSMRADVADGVDPNGNVINPHKAQIGDVEETLRDSLDTYCDPSCLDDPHKGSFMIFAGMVNIGWARQTFERGKYVTPTTCDGNYATLESRLASIADTYGVTTNVSKDLALMLDYWERPSARYPRLYNDDGSIKSKGGRRIIVIGEVLVHSNEWPYEKCDKYPAVQIQYQVNKGSVYGLNMVDDLREPQMAYNTLWSKIVTRINWEKLQIFVPIGSQLSKDFYKDPNDYDKWTVTQGQKPEFSTVPSFSPAYLDALKLIGDEMEYISGVRNVIGNDGIPGNISAETIELAQNIDKSRLHPFIGRIESALAELAEWETSLYRQYGKSFHRLLGLDDKAITGAKDMKGVALAQMDALKNGQCRVVYMPGSGVAKLPAARAEEIMNVFKEGGFGPPGSPASVEGLLTMLQSIRSDENVDKIIANVKRDLAIQQSMQPNPQQVQAQKDDAQAKLQGELEAIRVDGEMKLEGARTQADMNIQNTKDVNAVQLENLRHQNKMAEIMAANQVVPSVSLTGKLGSIATPSAEEAAGLKPDSSAEQAKIVAPPKPAAGNTK